MLFHRYKLWVWVAAFIACEGCGVLSAQSTAPKVADSQPSALATGPYYALVIGNNSYQHLPKLQTAVNDAKSIEELLRKQYGFQTKVLLDATRQQILDAIVQYRAELPEQSNLLIYYAGHGHHDRDTDESYWLPVDAQSDRNANWISADDITRDIRAISSAHVLVISDSCYSGSLTREADAAINPAEHDVYVTKMLKSKSRTLMSSGGDEPVTDNGTPSHSIFASVLLESLHRVDEDYFSAAELFHRFVQPGVAGRANQLPQYSLIRSSGHEYGDFVFARNSTITGTWKIDLTTVELPKSNIRLLLQNRVFECGSCLPPIRVVADGKEHRATEESPYYDQVAITILSQYAVAETLKKDGRIVAQAKWVVTPDGNLLTYEMIDKTNSKAVVSEYEAIRTSVRPETSDLISGSWQATKLNRVSEEALTMTYELTGDYLSMNTPAGEFYKARLDGTETRYNGDPGVTSVSVTRLANNLFEEKYRYAGGVIATRTEKIEGDTMFMTFDDKVLSTITTYRATRR